MDFLIRRLFRIDLFLLLGHFGVVLSHGRLMDNETVPVTPGLRCDTINQTCNVPGCPLFRCQHLPLEFIKCEELFDWEGNLTSKEEHDYGCAKFGGSRYEEVERGNTFCHVISCDIECVGDRIFKRRNLPCIKYTGHYFLSTLLYSMFLGIVAMDRFCLGHNGVAVGKLLSLGGFGIWWIVDIFLLVTGKLMPADDSNWMPDY